LHPTTQHLHESRPFPIASLFKYANVYNASSSQR